MNYNCVPVLILALILTACETVPEKKQQPFSLAEREALYDVKDWSFLGRFSLTDETNAVSATIEWGHQRQQDNIRLAGPFGQGRLDITLSDYEVEINADGQRKKLLGDVDELVSAELGVFVPVSSLKYWVLGLVAPAAVHTLLQDGFRQNGWEVRYGQMQMNKGYNMPRKMKIEKGPVRLKLIINQWDI